MKPEYEVRISGIDIIEIKDRLEKLGATKIGDKNYKRYIYEHNPKQEHSWIRLRTDGNKTTLTIKDVQNKKIGGTKETEIIVNCIKETNILLNQLGLFHRSYQENLRTSYILNEVNIEIDSWPMIPPHVEIEGKSVEEVERMIETLGFQKSDATTETVSDIYTVHGIDLESIKELKFEN